jgi:putative addiction module killer protein
MTTYAVWRYRANNSKVPVNDWLWGLRDAAARVAIDRRILRMELGNFGDHKYCRDGVWELRVDVGPGYRVYYAIAGSQIVLLLCGGDKRTQSADITRATQYWDEWQRRTEHERSIE